MGFNWEKNRNRAMWKRAHREAPLTRRPKPLRPGTIEALDYLRHSCLPNGSKFLEDMVAKAMADPTWVPTPKQEEVILRMKRERAEREERP